MGASDPVASFGLAIALILVLAKLGGDLASRLRQPPVLGELLAGILLGSIPRAPWVDIRSDPHVDMLARLGAVVLLFEIGLDTTVREVMQVGLGAARVAFLGIAGTLLLGWAAMVVTLPSAPPLVHLFMAAAVTATSVGVSARVLQDASAARSREAYTILAAAVIDDVLALLMLTLVSGAVSRATAGAAPTPRSVAWQLAKAVAFLVAAPLVGVKLSSAIFRVVSRLRTRGALLAIGLSFCFVLAWASNAMGLAPIVGAFAAGLILEESHSAPFVARGEHSLAQRLEPISFWLVPIFFVVLGMRADMRALTHPSTLLVVAALAVAAVGGKMACALGVPRGADRLVVACGMLPRGEVSLVFASVGKSLEILDAAQYAAIMAVVVVSTLVTPPALRGRLIAAASRSHFVGQGGGLGDGQGRGG
jgi:Kef-type K+ transport system membrane component KefB